MVCGDLLGLDVRTKINKTCAEEKIDHVPKFIIYCGLNEIN